MRHPATRLSFGCLLVASAAAACSGAIHDPPASDGDDPQCGYVDDRPIQRLSHAEYRHTIRDLFPGLDDDVDAFVGELAPDPTPHGFDNDALSLRASPLLVNQYYDVALRVSRRVRERQADFLGCDPNAGGDAATTCGHQYLGRLTERAFRRPVAPDELATILGTFDAHLAASGFDPALELTIQVILQSPQFLYRIEARGTDGRPSAYDVASRLSYLVWSTMPDQGLLAAAADGRLATREGVEAEVRRLLDDPRAVDGFMNFAGQWLNLPRLDRVAKLPEDDFTSGLRYALAEEARLFLAEVIYARGGSVQDLLQSPSAFVSAETAALYGLPAPAAGGFAEVQLEGRRGFLMQAQWLTAHGHPKNPSPVLRGLFVLQRLLCAEMGAPPPGVDMNIPEGDPDMGPTTNRQNYDRATMGGEPCVQCHSVMNPVGYAFEHFDTMGRWRELDNGLTIDDSGRIAGTDVAGADGLVDYLAASDQVTSCVANKWLYYALAGSQDAESSCLRQDVLTAFQASGQSLRELMFIVATHPRFTGLAPEGK